MKKSEHPHIFITGLVYPAFLGAFLYETAQRLSELTFSQYALLIPLILLFSFDYLYTADEARKKLYNFRRMFIDLGLVLLLYLSLRYALSPAKQDFSYIWLFLVSYKLVSLLWELAGKPDKQRRLASISYVTFFVLYGLGFLFFRSATLVLIIVLSVDTLIFWRWESICHRLGTWKVWGR
jgi:hypothetical protein